MADDSGIPWGAIIQGAGQVIGGMQRAEGAQGASDIERDAYLRALAMLQGGQLTPSVERVAPISRPAGDLEAKMAQRDALTRLQEAAREGFNTIDRAAINRAMSQSNQNERMQREAALARLDPNSGAAMAARLGAQQSSANRANQQALDIAAMSRQRALQSLGAYGSLAGRMRDQEYGEQSAIDKFNAELSRFNAGQANNASQAGIGNKLNALQLAGGAGSRLGLGMVRAANEKGDLSQTIGNAGGNLVNAYGEQNKNGGGTTLQNTPNWQEPGTASDPSEWEDPYEYDDRHGLK
jgi:hypothetical protein